MQKIALEALANRLHDARLNARPIEQFKKEYPDLNEQDAYAIQETGLFLRQKVGEKLIGYKMGLTSKAKREQMNLHSAVYGVLTKHMEVEDGGVLSLQQSRGIHPKIEPEIAFKIGRELKGNITFAEAQAAISGVHAAMEILDSRYQQFKYFSLEEVIADNSSSFYFVVSQKSVPLKDLDLANLNMRMSVDGEVKEQGISSAISDHPVNSIIQLCQMLHRRNQFIPAGSLILAGAATTAVMLRPGMKVELTVDHLPPVNIAIEA